MIDASYTADGALMLTVLDETGRVIAEGRVRGPEGDDSARVSWWPAGDHELLAKTARQQATALGRLAENADWLDWQYFQT